MEISDVRVKMISDAADRLKAVCAVTFDEEFVVRDVKVVTGTSGLFVAMPSRKVSVSCPKCRFKNPIRSRFCSECGARVPAAELQEDENGRSRFHRDIAHPITTPFREKLQAAVLEAYEAESTGGGGQRDYESDDEEEKTPQPKGRTKHEEVDDDDNEMTEYDAIIAGLRSNNGGRGSSSRPTSDKRRDRAAAPPRREERDRGRDAERPQPRTVGSDRSAPPRGSSSRPAPPPERKPSESRPVPVSESRPRRPVETPTVKAVETNVPEGFGEGIIGEVEKPKRPVRSPEPQRAERQPEKPAPTIQDDDDMGSFGAGL